MAELGFVARSFAGVTESCCVGRAWRGHVAGGVWWRSGVPGLPRGILRQS